jgi:hypothetical protein
METTPRTVESFELTAPRRPARLASGFRARADRPNRQQSLSTPTSTELKKAKKRIRMVEDAVAILKIVSKLLGVDRPHPEDFTP